MKNLLLLSVVLSLLACSGPSGDAVNTVAGEIVRTVKEVPAAATGGFATADITIDGMSCMMSCGSSIRKALAGIPGVQSAEIDFNEEEGNDHARVVYDEKVVTDAQLIEAVRAVRNGAYKVTAVEVGHPVQGGSTQDGDAGAEAESKGVNASIPGIILPGLFELLTRLVRI
ncbi:MAG: heavy-metal-associated domain-containing protein [Flavobacteriales bacterium]|nr:heavy-metal-associated domain-containing protein [Flavobacteriales bacterium]